MAAISVAQSVRPSAQALRSPTGFTEIGGNGLASSAAALVVVAAVAGATAPSPSPRQKPRAFGSRARVRKASLQAYGSKPTHAGAHTPPLLAQINRAAAATAAARAPFSPRKSCRWLRAQRVLAHQISRRLGCWRQKIMTPIGRNDSFYNLNVQVECK